MESYLLLYIALLFTTALALVVHVGKRDVQIEFLGISIHLKSK